ncbi:putative long-chain-alcohol O-fatty-acyltransferase 8 [Nymphaea thermarum]|nr:putative long-chain-alcohol O-fatty-acyltransferase 8 [Nymphaea thermarum]
MRTAVLESEKRTVSFSAGDIFLLSDNFRHFIFRNGILRPLTAFSHLRLSGVSRSSHCYWSPSALSFAYVGPKKIPLCYLLIIGTAHCEAHSVWKKPRPFATFVQGKNMCMSINLLIASRDRQRMKEVSAVVRVWLSAMAALIYVRTVVSRLPKNLPRLVATLPVVYLFFLLPWQISSIAIRTSTAFCLSWMSNFKLLLFCFDAGPLPLHRHSLRRFLAFAALPIEAKPLDPKKVQHHHRGLLLSRTLPRIALACALTVPTVEACASDFVQRHRAAVLPLLYTLVLFAPLDVLLGAATVPARLFLGVQLHSQFDRPYISTSLGDFWGRRWNLAVTTILRPAVYCPVRSACSRLVGSSPARLVATLATFLVSGLMHELMLYYPMVEPPTWEWATFFVLHGFLTSGELCLKWVVGAPSLPRLVSVLLTLTVMYVTAAWLFYPPLMRGSFETMAAAELRSAMDALSTSLLQVQSKLNVAGRG